MADGVVLEKELARERSVGVERHRSGSIELLVAERANRGRGCAAVAPKQVDSRLYRHAIVCLGVLGIERVDDVPCHVADWLPRGKRLRQLDFQRVHGRNVVNDDADRASVSRDAGLPRLRRERARHGFEGSGALLEALGKRVRAPAGRRR